MTYDSRFHFGTLTPFGSEDLLTIIEIAQLDVKKCGDNTTATGKFIAEQIRLAKAGKARAFNLDNATGTGYISKDSYGDPLAELPIHELLTALKQDQVTEYYRRFDLAIRIIEGILADDEWSNDDPVVFHYGH